LIRRILEKQRPIGSKVLAKIIKNKFAAPTLRIYLRKIARAGYLEKKTSFLGRIPTEKGLYYYLKNYKLRPELNFPDLENLSLENCLNYVTNFTKNIVFYKEKKLLIKGLKNVVDFKDKELIKELLTLSEKIEKIIEYISEEKINVLIGSKLEKFGGKNSSLIAYKSKNFSIGFLGPKINCYHTNLILLQKLIQKIKND
jgi:transcriptional regulator of heat shock response